MTVYANASKYGPNWLPKWNPVDQQITFPSVIWVYLQGTTTPAVLFTDYTHAGTVPNPVETGVLPNNAGLDVTGNLICFADTGPGTDSPSGEYDLLMDGTLMTVRFIPLDSDMQAAYVDAWT